MNVTVDVNEIPTEKMHDNGLKYSDNARDETNLVDNAQGAS